MIIMLFWLKTSDMIHFLIVIPLANWPIGITLMAISVNNLQPFNHAILLLPVRPRPSNQSVNP